MVNLRAFIEFNEIKGIELSKSQMLLDIQVKQSLSVSPLFAFLGKNNIKGKIIRPLTFWMYTSMNIIDIMN